MTLHADQEALSGRLAIFHPAGRMSLAHNPFGKDVANLQLWQALARYGGFERIDVLSIQPTTDELLVEDLLDGCRNGVELAASSIFAHAAAAQSGLLLRGQPDLADLAWMRRRTAGDRAYSLVGLVHTLAPPTIRQMIAAASTAPMHPWDALVCTSPSVRQGLEAMFDGWEAHLAERTGGRAPPRPQLPVIPLGVDAPAMAALADRPVACAQVRRELGLGEDDVLVLWIGRLSYYEKAFPQPMFAALQKARAASGAKIAFVMAGWFPDPADRGRYEAAARTHAPDVPVQIVDGNDRARLGELWAGADVFLSLVDNVQETFGITPLEAMAAGLPVVASDWDGYRFTVRHGVEGFLIPTLLAPAGGGLGWAAVERHVVGGGAYQSYVGQAAQHTAVHIGRAAEALAALARSPELRRRMGAAGRARVKDAFDWPVVARQVHALTCELAAIRAAAPDPPAGQRGDPVKGDPFVQFGHFATERLTLDTALWAAPGVSEDTVRSVSGALDLAFGGFRASPETCARALGFLATNPGAQVRDVLRAFPVGERRGLETGLGWMAKYGFVDWLT